MVLPATTAQFCQLKEHSKTKWVNHPDRSLSYNFFTTSKMLWSSSNPRRLRHQTCCPNTLQSNRCRIKNTNYRIQCLFIVIPLIATFTSSSPNHFLCSSIGQPCAAYFTTHLESHKRSQSSKCVVFVRLFSNSPSCVIQMEPLPIPTLSPSTPASIRFLAWAAVTTAAERGRQRCSLNVL